MRYGFFLFDCIYILWIRAPTVPAEINYVAEFDYFVVVVLTLFNVDFMLDQEVRLYIPANLASLH